MLDIDLIKVKAVEENDMYGKFEIEPLDRGFGQTLGTSLRRVLLSSLKGAAVTSIKINGAKHEYTAVPGIEEDIMNIVLNVKKLRLKSFTDEKQTLYLRVKKAGSVVAGDLEIPSTVEILNKELVIATVSDIKNPLTMELTVETGIGYALIEEERQELGLIPVDANFSPVERVNFTVSSARVGQVTDLDKVTIEVFTRSISPREAFAEALRIYISILNKVHASVTEEVVQENQE